jgi:hypothetical protein
LEVEEAEGEESAAEASGEGERTPFVLVLVVLNAIASTAELELTGERRSGDRVPASLEVLTLRLLPNEYPPFGRGEPGRGELDRRPHIVGEPLRTGTGDVTPEPEPKVAEGICGEARTEDEDVARACRGRLPV